MTGTRYQLESAHDPDIGSNALQSYKLTQNPFFRLETDDFGDGGKVPVLVLQRLLDRENSARHTLILTAIDGGKPQKTGTLTINVVVSDINDNAPNCGKQKYTVTVKEDAPAGTLLLRINATDSDEGGNGEIEFSLRSKFRNGASDLFDLHNKTGELRIKGGLNFEEKQVYELKILAADKGAVSLSTQCNVFVKVEDVNDNRPEIDVTSISDRIYEDARPGTVIALMGVTDMDSGVNGQVVCSLPENLPFELKQSSDSNFYSLVTKWNLDKESKSFYDIAITAKDLGIPPQSSTKIIHVEVMDVNDNSPVFIQSPYNFYVAENNKPGMFVFSVSAADADEGENARVSYSIDHVNSDTIVTSFMNINDESGAVFALKKFDFESMKMFQFHVLATDSGTPPLSSNVTVNVFILDQNDNVPVILYPVSANGSAEGVEEIPRNVNAGHLVTKVRAYDADIGYNETGVIHALKSFDFEITKMFQFHVLATDSGTPSLSSNVTVNVFILDQNDNVPVILYPVSANGSAEGVEEIPRNVNAGHLVTKVRTYDADIGYNGWLLFSLQEVSDHSLFSLDRYTGQIRTLRAFTETDETEHKLVILVKDNGNVSLSATATLIIKLVEPKEAFAASDVKNAVNDVEENNVTFYLIVTLGSVSFLFIISIIVLIVMQCSKSTDYSSKYLQDTNYDGTLCHSIQYRSGDKRYMLVGPRTSIGSTLVPGSNANTLVIQDRRRRTSVENDNVPVILYPVSANGSAEGVEEIPHNVNAGHLVTKVRAYDADIGYNGWLLFSLQECSKSTNYSSKYLQDTNYDGTLCHSIQYRSGDKRYMLVGPRMSTGSTIVPGSKANTLVLPDRRRRTSDEIQYSTPEEVKSGLWEILLRILILISVISKEQVETWDPGVIHALKSFDYEVAKTFQFHVLATDSGTPSLSSNVTVNVFILDQNDNVPVILYPVSANGSAEGVEEIPRNVNAGHLVTKVRAYDADIGYNGWLLFSLQEVSDHSLFGLDRYTGQIRTLRSFTETDKAEYNLVILVKDNGNVSLSASATMIIKLVEPKEAFAASDVKNGVSEVEENNVTFYLIITLGSVSFLFMISIIVLIVMQCSKSTDYSSKYLQETNYDGTLCHSIQYRSGDKRYMLVGPRMSIGSTLVPGSNGNTLVVPDRRRRTPDEVKFETIIFAF
ncbi:hypothetical protein QTP70_011811 [Hemibagrus guttatus]|uniref:Cadherin domain-containing protein n=1 Tax=Hemibagrus guttatus TaxID=175788 RepID=A0AAE0QMW9_9TELE|nr:hypothetical protein QTP70_011811 [Hemibagrus guttatus]